MTINRDAPASPDTSDSAQIPLIAKVQLAKAIVVPVYSQVMAMMTTTDVGLIVIELNAHVTQFQKVPIDNGVAEIPSGRPSTVLLSNFGTQPRSLPKSMVIALASKHLIALVPIGGQLRKNLPRA